MFVMLQWLGIAIVNAKNCVFFNRQDINALILLIGIWQLNGDLSKMPLVCQNTKGTFNINSYL